MQFTFSKIAFLLWGIFFSYWFLSSLGRRSKIEYRESLASRASYFIILGLGISLIVFDPLFYGALLWRILPQGLIVDLAGLALVILGLGFAAWARLYLGRYWSARITLAEDHQLIRTGPYGLVRNPIYSGGLAAVLGTAIVLGEVRGVLAIALVLIAFLRKIHLEERWLAERFGPAYLEYQRRVKALIPFVY